ncbi:hypothetical protein BKI52_31235 [marine bacterium AO1-C]|nr:hypothetical protein BKI52_31235 [marine bacterium AO1-C]
MNQSQNIRPNSKQAYYHTAYVFSILFVVIGVICSVITLYELSSKRLFLSLGKQAQGEVRGYYKVKPVRGSKETPKFYLTVKFKTQSGTEAEGGFEFLRGSNVKKYKKGDKMNIKYLPSKFYKKKIIRFDEATFWNIYYPSILMIALTVVSFIVCLISRKKRNL